MLEGPEGADRSARRKLGFGALLAAGTLALAGIAVAAIPDQTGVIHGCVSQNNGDLRLVDPATGATCKTNEAAIQWSQSGPQGPQGARGSAGPVSYPEPFSLVVAC